MERTSSELTFLEPSRSPPPPHLYYPETPFGLPALDPRTQLLLGTLPGGGGCGGSG